MSLLRADSAHANAVIDEGISCSHSAQSFHDPT